MRMIGLLCATVLFLFYPACGDDDEEEKIGKRTFAPNFNFAPDAGAPTDAAPRPTAGLRDSRVTCTACSPELLAAKAAGINAAMAWLVEFLGSDLDPRWAPATFHLDGDEACGTWTPTTHPYAVPDQGQAKICLFDIERSWPFPFDLAHAGLPGSQITPVHEAGHAWLWTRMTNDVIQEALVQYLSVIYAGRYVWPELLTAPGNQCALFLRRRYDNTISGLNYDLCDLGLNDASFQRIMRSTAATAKARGNAITVPAFAAIVSAELGTDATEAFRAAGLL